jgi:aminoglycoside 6-adenylyltransferase
MPAAMPAEWLDGMTAGILPGIPADIADIIRRGVRVLVDKDGKLAQILNLPLPALPLQQKPLEAEFVNAINDFWYHTLWSAKHLQRGELWWAKSGVDMHLKGLLLRMLEWHARAINGDQYDT